MPSFVMQISRAETKILIGVVPQFIRNLYVFFQEYKQINIQMLGKYQKIPVAHKILGLTPIVNLFWSRPIESVGADKTCVCSIDSVSLLQSGLTLDFSLRVYLTPFQ